MKKRITKNMKLDMQWYVAEWGYMEIGSKCLYTPKGMTEPRVGVVEGYRIVVTKDKAHMNYKITFYLMNVKKSEYVSVVCRRVRPFNTNATPVVYDDQYLEKNSF